MSTQCYRFVVRGELGPRYASAFEGMTVSIHSGMTEISGTIIDASHPQGLLERIAGLGLELHSLAPLETDEAKRQANDLPPRESNRR